MNEPRSLLYHIARSSVLTPLDVVNELFGDSVLFSERHGNLNEMRIRTIYLYEA